MAIDSRNLSIEGVHDILYEGMTALHAISATDQSNNLLMAIERITAKIKFLQDLEEQVLSLFPTPNDREAVREKVVEYNNSNFANFFGVNLKQTFIDEFFKAVKATKNEEYREQNALAQYLINELSKDLDPTIPKKEIAQELAKKFNFTLSAVITEGGTRFATKKLDIVELQDTGPRIMVEKLTPPMRERLRQILIRLNGGKADYQFPFLDDVKLSEFRTNKDSIDIQVTSEWFNSTKGMSANKIQEKISKDPAKWEPFVEKANNNIIKLLSKEVSGEVRMYLENYLRGLVVKDPFVFFIGKSTTDITGLLGEINAVLAIQKLTGKTVSVDWIAHHTSEKNKKVSIDVVLKGVLGINVKNTTQKFSQHEGFHDVSFVDRSPDKILNTLLENTEYSDALSDAFQTSYFNMSYQIIPSRPHVVKGSNSNFDNLERGLVIFREHLITYLYQFAPEMLYMATDDLDKQLLVLNAELDKTIAGVGNILYMVGGVPFFPSEMMNDLLLDLQSLQNDLQNGTRVRKESFFFKVGKGSSENIVGYLNDKAKQGQSVALHSIGGNENITTIQMTSSWLF